MRTATPRSGRKEIVKLCACPKEFDFEYGGLNCQLEKGKVTDPKIWVIKSRGPRAEKWLTHY